MSTPLDRAEAAYELLKELLRVDNTNLPGNERACADILAKRLSEFSPKILEKEPGRANLVAKLSGGKKGLLLAAHLDTVPPGEPWTHPPFAAVEEDGYLYGRGALDMKHMAAQFAVIFEEASRKTLKRDLILACVADEEMGGALGSGFLVDEHPELVRAEAMLGEGGGWYQYLGAFKYCPIGVAEKGQSIVRLKVPGRGGHGSIPDDGNAAFKLRRVLECLEPARAKVRVSAPVDEFFKSLSGGLGGAKGAALQGLRHPLTAMSVLRVLPAAVRAPLRALLTNTASPTRLQGSDTVNVIPHEIVLDLDVRTLPGSGLDDFLTDLWERLGEELPYEVLSSTPAVASRPATEFFAVLKAAIRKHDPACLPVPFLIPGYTDARHFSRLGMDCYGCGILPLEPRDSAELKNRIHGLDERVPKEAFLKGYMALEDAVLTYVAEA